ncbi:hypothetical protein KJC03_13150 [Mammaliicoccus sciuri]|uniref:hypothetical protein n=1 Tax=Mammaliicoccus sciuri TaxID=1296 RepID=UPI001F176419|nr:hypothetical protein [Mammaliicoccus sciuri]MCE5042029.1 hypothetical protein [Mammaliicoccus sciuri]
MKKIFLILFSIIFLMSACGKSNEKKEVKYSELMNSKNTIISYLVKSNDEDSASIGKDSEVISYIVSKNGKYTIYEGGNTTLGEIIKKDDDDKLDYIKKQDKEYFEDEVEMSINAIKIDDNNDELIKSLQNFKYDKPKERDIQIELETDESGNNTKREFFNIASHGFKGDGGIDVGAKNAEELYDKDKKMANPKEYGYYFTNVVSPFDLYDKKLAGLSNIDDIEDNNDYDEPAYEDYKYLVTEVGSETEKFKIDQPDDKNVKVTD